MKARQQQRTRRRRAGCRQGSARSWSITNLNKVPRSKFHSRSDGGWCSSTDGGQRVHPWTEDRHPSSGKVSAVPGGDRQPVVQSGRGDDQVGLGEGMASPLAFLEQMPPSEHHILNDRQDTSGEHRAQPMGQPVLKFQAARWVRCAFDAVSDFGERHDTGVQAFERLTSQESEDFGLRSRPNGLRQDVPVQQTSVHRTTSRAWVRWDSSRMSKSGAGKPAVLRPAPDRFVRPESLHRQDDRFFPPMHRYVLRSVGAGAAQDFAQPSLRVLQGPSVRLAGWLAWCCAGAGSQFGRSD